MSMCRVFSCVIGRGCLLWPVCSLGKTLLAFSLLHSILHGQISLLLQMFLDLLLFLAERSNPTSTEWWLRRCRSAERSYSIFKVRRPGREEIPLVQGKEQQLRFVGAAIKRYRTSKKRNPTKTVGIARRHQGTDTLKPISQKTIQSDHMDHTQWN